jgi:hypothetical protein
MGLAPIADAAARRHGRRAGAARAGRGLVSAPGFNSDNTQCGDGEQDCYARRATTSHASSLHDQIAPGGDSWRPGRTHRQISNARSLQASSTSMYVCNAECQAHLRPFLARLAIGTTQTRDLHGDRPHQAGPAHQVDGTCLLRLAPEPGRPCGPRTSTKPPTPRRPEGRLLSTSRSTSRCVN